MRTNPRSVDFDKLPEDWPAFLVMADAAETAELTVYKAALGNGATDSLSPNNCPFCEVRKVHVEPPGQNFSRTLPYMSALNHCGLRHFLPDNSPAYATEAYEYDALQARIEDHHLQPVYQKDSGQRLLAIDLLVLLLEGSKTASKPYPELIALLWLYRQAPLFMHVVEITCPSGKTAQTRLMACLAPLFREAQGTDEPCFTPGPFVSLISGVTATVTRCYPLLERTRYVALILEKEDPATHLNRLLQAMDSPLRGSVGSRSVFKLSGGSAKLKNKFQAIGRMCARPGHGDGAALWLMAFADKDNHTEVLGFRASLMPTTRAIKRRVAAAELDEADEDAEVEQLFTDGQASHLVDASIAKTRLWVSQLIKKHEEDWNKDENDVCTEFKRGLLRVVRKNNVHIVDMEGTHNVYDFVSYTTTLHEEILSHGSPDLDNLKAWAKAMGALACKAPHEYDLAEVRKADGRLLLMTAPELGALLNPTYGCNELRIQSVANVVKHAYKTGLALANDSKATVSEPMAFAAGYFTHLESMQTILTAMQGTILQAAQNPTHKTVVDNLGSYKVWFGTLKMRSLCFDIALAFCLGVFEATQRGSVTVTQLKARFKHEFSFRHSILPMITVDKMPRSDLAVLVPQKDLYGHPFWFGAEAYACQTGYRMSGYAWMRGPDGHVTQTMPHLWYGFSVLDGFSGNDLWESNPLALVVVWVGQTLADDTAKLLLQNDKAAVAFAGWVLTHLAPDCKLNNLAAVGMAALRSWDDFGEDIEAAGWAHKFLDHVADVGPSVTARAVHTAEETEATQPDVRAATPAWVQALAKVFDAYTAEIAADAALTAFPRVLIDMRALLGRDRTNLFSALPSEADLTKAVGIAV